MMPRLTNLTFLHIVDVGLKKGNTNLKKEEAYSTQNK